MAQQESPIPCHNTTGKDVELNDVSYLLGRGLYGLGSVLGDVQLKKTNNSASKQASERTKRLRLLTCDCDTIVGSRSTREASTLTSSSRRLYLPEAITSATCHGSAVANKKASESDQELTRQPISLCTYINARCGALAQLLGAGIHDL